MIYTIFTVPPSRRAEAADPETWTKWRRAIWKYLRENHGGLFAVERTDPAGDASPGIWHPHLNFLWVQRDGFRPYIPEAQLKIAWAKIIGVNYKPDAWTQFSDNPGKLRHWYSYMGRTWPDWVIPVRRHLTMRWLGSYPAKPPPDPVCKCCGGIVVSVRCSSKAEAEELVAQGPSAVYERAFESRNRPTDIAEHVEAFLNLRGIA